MQWHYECVKNIVKLNQCYQHIDFLVYMFGVIIVVNKG